MTLSSLLLQSDFQLYNIALLILRIFIGVCFVIHGLGKLGIVGKGNMKGFTAWLKSLKVPYPAVQARMAMGSELIGGLLISTGLFMRVGCLLVIPVMLVAAAIGHKGGGYLLTNNPPGNEYTINLAAVCAVLFILGPGSYSLDAILF